MEGSKTHLTPTVDQGVVLQTPPRSTSTHVSEGFPHHVIVKKRSNPSTPAASLDWDSSCLQDPFHVVTHPVSPLIRSYS